MAAGWIADLLRELDEDEALADQVEQLVLDTHSKKSFVPTYMRFVDAAGVVLSQGPVQRNGDSFSYYDSSADCTGTLDHVVLTDARGFEFKTDIQMNTRSICTGACIEVKNLFITYD